MNKDKGPFSGSLSRNTMQCRINLELSDKAIKDELKKNQMHYINESELTEPHLLVMGRSMDCKNCAKIPNDMWECAKCSEIHCCVCKDEGVKCCRQSEFVKLKNKQIIQQINDTKIEIMHTCDQVDPNVPAESQKIRYSKYNWKSLFSHMKSCPKIPLNCPNCNKKFECSGSMTAHLRSECQKVSITCNGCDKEFLRPYFFSKHECTANVQDWRYLVNEYDVRITQLEGEKGKLEGQLGEVKGEKQNSELALKTNVGQRTFVQTLISKQIKERENIYSKVTQSTYGGETYDIRDKFVFTDLKTETCFECCNEHFAKDLILANKSNYG